jgi:hypothetical protein
MGFLRTERGEGDRLESEAGRKRQAKSRALRLRCEVGDLEEWDQWFKEIEAAFQRQYGPEYRLPATYGNGRRAASINWRTRKLKHHVPEYLKPYVGSENGKDNLTKDDLPPSPKAVRSALKALKK